MCIEGQHSACVSKGSIASGQMPGPSPRPKPIGRVASAHGNSLAACRARWPQKQYMLATLAPQSSLTWWHEEHLLWWLLLAAS